jgi:ATP-dependent Clp protease ATP-binding subunit ClpA
MNFASQTQTVRELMPDAMDVAHRLGDARFGTEHVLLALCQLSDSDAVRIIRTAGAKPRDLMADVLRVAEKDAENLTLLEARPTPLAERPDLPITPRVRRVIAGVARKGVRRSESIPSYTSDHSTLYGTRHPTRTDWILESSWRGLSAD